MRLTGKTALITGSTSGVGKSIAYRYAENGANVVITGLDDEHGKQIVEHLRDQGGSAVFIPGDLNHEQDAARLVQGTVEEFGRLDILVNNAAATHLMADSTRPLAEATTEEFEAIMRVAVYGTFWCCKYAMPHLIDTGKGSIINISSMASLRGFNGIPAYSAAKGAVNSLGRQIVADYGPLGVRCNTIVIGVVVTEFVSGMIATPEARAALTSVHPTTRLGEPSDVAKLAVFLGSDESEFMSAGELLVDGGSTTLGPLTGNQIKSAVRADQ